jgi:hypothetical protein
MRREMNFWKGLQEGLLEGLSVVVPCSSLGSPRRGLRPGIFPAFSQLPNDKDDSSTRSRHHSTHCCTATCYFPRLVRPFDRVKVALEGNPRRSVIFLCCVVISDGLRHYRLNKSFELFVPGHSEWGWY